MSASTRCSLHADHQGSIVAISTGSGGTLLTANTHDAYGVRTETVRCYDKRPDPTPTLTPRRPHACLDLMLQLQVRQSLKEMGLR